MNKITTPKLGERGVRVERGRRREEDGARRVQGSHRIVYRNLTLFKYLKQSSGTSGDSIEMQHIERRLHHHDVRVK